ncbi:MAG: tetratricopeptide repeat protein [Anaerolineales bacterium]|nr:tetratricopeptide repeat protein [Anaerolineales bacterium]
MLSFTLLGQTVLSKNGLPLAQFRSQKEVALLIYLAQTRQSHQRDFLADLLWESSSTKQSLSNLRTALARLRKQVGDSLLVTRKTLALAPESQQQVDSVNLLQSLKSIGPIDSAEKAATLQKALNTYQGDFLADFHLPDAQQFTEWVVITREYIRRQVISAFQKLMEYALTTNDVSGGIMIARRWLAVDALDETAHTLLIQQLLKADCVQEALAHYDHCVALLQAELGIAPPDKMTALVRDARPKRAIISRPTTEIRHNLPAEYDQFFGRQAAQQEIHVRLDQPWCRLITITGQGGMGKTRLATTIARSRLNQYRDGVWLVELENIEPDDEDLAEAIAVEIATILDLRLSGSATPIEQLLNHLQHKQMMLVLDNFEHLVAGRQIVLDMIQQCEQVQLIVTSREALRLRAEWAIALAGLSYPASDTDEMPSEAVELFAARRAQRQRSTVSADELAAIRAICRMVAGLPLAIELAAALTHQASARQVAARLQSSFDTLTASLHDMPDRHRGLHMVFEMSWRTLTPALQLDLARLSIFRGGFTETAAYQITAADAQQLSTLIDKSLLTYHGETNRYTLNPVIRAYSAEKREPTDPTPQKHANYYLTLLAQHTKPLQQERPQDSMSLLEPDIDNIRRAWQTGLAERNEKLLCNALTSLSTYYQLRGLAREGEAVMHKTLRTANTWGAEGLPLATRAGLEQVRFLNRLGHYRPAIRIIKTTLGLASAGMDRWAEGMGHVLWGESLWRLGDYETAKVKLIHALDISHTLNALLITGWCFHHLGIIHDIQSRYDTAHNHLEKACATWRKLDNAQALSGSLNSIGLVCYHQGNLNAAQQALEQALSICEQSGDRHRQSSLVNNLSMILTERSDYAGAQYYLQLGLELATASGNLTGQGELNINLGKNFRLLGETDLAVERLEQGLQLSESIENRSLTATALIYLADTKREQGDSKLAQSLYSQALKIGQQNQLQRIECAALIGMAELLSRIDEKQARKYSAEAVTLAETIQDSQLLKRAKNIKQNLSMSANLNEKNLPR